MPAPSSFDYAVIRVVPRVDREEFLNAGVIVFSIAHDFLGARVHVDEDRLRSLWPEVDLTLVRDHLDAFTRVGEGRADAGPIAQLSQRERFHWLVSPRSTMIQVSPVHSGLCNDPAATLDRLFQQLVLR